MNVKGYIKNFGLFMFLRNGFSRVLRKAKGSRKFLNRYDNYKHKYHKPDCKNFALLYSYLLP